MAPLVRTLMPLACAAWLVALCPSWASEDQQDRFIEVQNGDSTTSLDLSTVQMIQPGRFSVISTVIDNPDVMKFELNVLAILHTYCARGAGRYAARANLLTLRSPSTAVGKIEVIGNEQSKFVMWTYPYQKLHGQLVVSCASDSKEDHREYLEQRAEITNGSRLRILYDCRRGLIGIFFNESQDPGKVITRFVKRDTVGEEEYFRVCLSVTGEPPYLAAGSPLAAVANSLQHQPTPPSGATANNEPSSVELGAAFFVSESGMLLTNAHVVPKCTEVSVGPRRLMLSTFPPDQMAKAKAAAKAAGYSEDQIEAALNQPLKARVIARDEKNDLALLRADISPQAVAALRLSVRQGEAVVAYGFPLPGLLASGGNFTEGNVAALSGIGDDSRILQISAPVQPGNSGGPLLDNSGNVVGIVEAKLDAAKVTTAIGDVPQNVNFAIKAAVVATFLDSNGVHYATGQPGAARSPADIAEEAKRFTVPVECISSVQ